MKPKTTSILIALLINLGLMIGGPNSQMGASAEQSSAVWFHCCKENPEGRPYCCRDCCYFRFDCLDDEDCKPRS